MVSNHSSLLPKVPLDLSGLWGMKVCWVFSDYEIQLSHLLDEWVGRHILLLLFFFPEPKVHSSAQKTQLLQSFQKKKFE